MPEDELAAKDGMAIADEAGRAAIYAGFADLFIDPPSAADIEEWRARGDVAPLAALAGVPGFQHHVARAMESIAGAAEAGDAARALNRAFCRLFLGVGGIRHAAPPYESAYDGDASRLFGAATGEMQDRLAQRGLAVAADCREPPDHLSLELAFMAALLDMGDARARDEAGTFLRTHLLAWVPSFAARCAACDESGFYAALSALLHAFLLKECTFLITMEV